jgi:hypothetical protein
VNFPPFFAVSVERWCRLRGNLLFYFKSRDHWSEPAGVIVIEDCDVKAEVNNHESTFGILLIFGGRAGQHTGQHAGQHAAAGQQHLATYTENERQVWMTALKTASHRHMRSHLEDLRSRLRAKLTSAGFEVSSGLENAGRSRDVEATEQNSNSKKTTSIVPVIGKLLWTLCAALCGTLCLF